MKWKTKTIGKRYRKWLACALAGVMFVQGYYAAASEPDGSLESISENSLEGQDAVEETEIQEAEKNDVWPEETVSQNSISENSISENSTESEMTDIDEEAPENGEAGETPGSTDEAGSVSENTTEESVSENTAGESVSENTTEESVSENTAGESVSENTTEESVPENTTEESVSGNTTGASASTDIMSVTPMTVASAEGRNAELLTAPVIKSVVPKDLTAELRFTHQLGETQQIQYEALIRDEVKGEDLAIQPGTGDGIVTIEGYDGKAVNVFRITGLSSNKKYSVVLRAKYGETGEPVSSAKKVFTTKKDMIATDGSMKVRYADMEQLKDRSKTPEDVPVTGVQMKTGESCALYAQVSRLMRAVETDRLKWTVTPLGENSPKNGLKVKASKSTYEAVLTAEQTGSYQVTAANTLSKETVSTFQVTVR